MRPAHSHVPMRIRVLGLVVVASIALACGQVAALLEPAPADLLQKANTNLKAAKTTHLDGTGSFALKGGFSFTFDFKMSGDAEVPDKARLNIQLNLFGQDVTAESITVGGKTYSKDTSSPTGGWHEAAANDPTQGGMLDPLGQADLSAVLNVKEVDRPDVDGRKTRHLSYTADTTKLVEKMSAAAASSSFKPTNPSGSGEVWIRVDDNQIVRQLVKLSFDIEGDLGLPIATGATASPAKASFEIGFDLKYSHIGEPITPSITAPATVAPTPVRTALPLPSGLRTPTPSPTR